MFNLKSYSEKRNLTSSFLGKRFANYLYFNELALATQSINPITYFRFMLKKSWFISNFSLNSTLCVQYSDNNALSVPLFFYDQKIQYTRKIFKNIMLSTSLSSSVFSSYYATLFSPETDVFYQQLETKTKLHPYLSGDIYISKNNFMFGIIFDNISSLFSQENYFIQSYALPTEPIVRMSLKWKLLD